MNGFLNIAKPAGWTSHDVVAKVRRLLGVPKVGHTGTLDPAATGVLPICIGKATKVAQFLLEMDKEYRVVMRLGVVTNTQDATGTVLQRKPVVSLTHEEILKTVKSFQGPLWQIAPMYSAVKVGGEPLYKAARQKKEVKRPSRRVVIYRITVFEIKDRVEDDVIDVAFEVACSKGTYIRTLCSDIGDRLEVGGHLYRLERSRSGPFTIGEAIKLEEVRQRSIEGTIGEKLISIHEVLSGYPNLQVTAKASGRVIHGGTIGIHEITSLPNEFKTGETVLVYNASGELIAMASAMIGSDQINNHQRTVPAFKVCRVLIQQKEGA
jgi:tRNA pseudouridine55 synthase